MRYVKGGLFKNWWDFCGISIIFMGISWDFGHFKNPQNPFCKWDFHEKAWAFTHPYLQQPTDQQTFFGAAAAAAAAHHHHHHQQQRYVYRRAIFAHQCKENH